MTAPESAGVLVHRLTKSFGATSVLGGVELEVKAGSLAVILGPSGSGKTTLLRLLAGFEQPDSGEIEIGGRTVAGAGRYVRPEARQIGYVPQEGSLFPHLDVAGNVGFGLQRKERRERVGELLEMTNLSELADRYPHQLSGGQQQRVALARSLAPWPSVVLLDEPFSSLDAFLRTSVRLEVIEVLRRSETTAVMVTHDQDEALSMADQVAVLRDGLVAQAGTPEELYLGPADEGLASFVGEANLVGGRLTKGLAVTSLGSFEPTASSEACPEGSDVVVVVRPEQIVLSPPSSGLEAVVERLDYHGHDTVVAVREASGERRSFNVRCVGAAGLAPGEKVGLSAGGSAPVWRCRPDGTASGRLSSE